MSKNQCFPFILFISLHQTCNVEHEIFFKMKLSRQLSGIAGEYYVAAELSRRGYLAAITLRNSDGVDILVNSIDGKNNFQVQVKTVQAKFKWPLSKKIERETSPNKFFVFVSLPTNPADKPKYFIITAQNLGKHIYESHVNWLKVPGKNGQPHKDNPMREFDPQYIQKEELLTWDHLIEHLN